MTASVCLHFNPIRTMSFTDVLQMASILIINVNVISIVSCFSCFARLGSMLLQVLIDDIARTDVLIRQKMIEDKIEKWQRFYRLAVNYLDQLNRGFGLALLCYTLKVFVISISNTFSFLITKAPDEFIADFRLVATHSLSFCNLVANCHQIQNQVMIVVVRHANFFHEIKESVCFSCLRSALNCGNSFTSRRELALKWISSWSKYCKRHRR